MTTGETRDTVLDIAQEFLQTRGFNGFSFRDVAERAGIKPASIHYYFPTKAELCRALIARQRDDVRAALRRIDDEQADPNAKLGRYASVFRATLELGNRMCLCGMLAADFETLDPSVVEDLRSSFRDHESWLESVLTEGAKTGVMDLAESPRDEARGILSALEGAMLIARAFGDVGRFESASRALLGRVRGVPLS